MSEDKNKSLGKCPICGKEVVENKKAFGCSGYKEGCTFAIWKANPFLEKFKVKSIDKKTAKLLIEHPEGITIRINSIILNAKLVKNGEYHNIEFKIQEEEKFSLGPCPKCGKGVVINSVAYTCEDKECNFVIFKDDKYLARYNKKPTESMIKTILSKGEVTVKNVESPNGKGKFDCTLRLKENGKYWGWDMQLGSDKEACIGKCPECGNDVVEGKLAYGCSNWKNGCKFAIWYNQLNGLGIEKINKTVAKKLLKMEKVELTLKSPKNSEEYTSLGILHKHEGKWSIKMERKDG